MEERSLITPLLWRASKSFLESYQLEHQILLLRLVNSIIFSACIFYIINIKFINSIILTVLFQHYYVYQTQFLTISFVFAY